MATEYKYTYAAWAEVFAIFAKYVPDEIGDVTAEHDQIWAGFDLVSKLTPEDEDRVRELGWHNTDFDAWTKYV